MICVGCEQPIREVLTPEGWEWEHIPEFAGFKDHPADPGKATAGAPEPRRHGMTSQEIYQATQGRSVIGTAADQEFIARGERAVEAARDYYLLRELLERAGHEAHVLELGDVENAVVDALGWVDTAEATTP